MTFFEAVRSLLASAVRRKAADAEAETMHGMLEAVIEGATDSIFVKDVDGRFIAVNASAAQTLGRTRDELIAQRVQVLMSGSITAALYGNGKAATHAGGLAELLLEQEP